MRLVKPRSLTRRRRVSCEENFFPMAAIAGDIGPTRSKFVDQSPQAPVHTPTAPRFCQDIGCCAVVRADIAESIGSLAIEECYADQDCAVLFGADRQPHDGNDDATGRARLKLV